MARYRSAPRTTEADVPLRPFLSTRSHPGGRNPVLPRSAGNGGHSPDRLSWSAASRSFPPIGPSGRPRSEGPALVDTLRSRSPDSSRYSAPRPGLRAYRGAIISTEAEKGLGAAKSLFLGHSRRPCLLFAPWSSPSGPPCVAPPPGVPAPPSRVPPAGGSQMWYDSATVADYPLPLHTP